MQKKIIILDFDGTFYSGKNIFSKVPNYVRKYRQSFLPNVSNEQYLKICKDNPEWLTALSGKEIAREIYKLKNKYPKLSISIDDFWNCQQEHIYDINLVDANIANPKEIKKICERYNVYLVSNSSPSHIEYYLKKFNMNSKWFKKIVSNHFDENDQTKKHLYQEIVEAEKVEANNVYVFGDSESSDLEPARLLGYKAFISVDADKLCDIINERLVEND